MTTIKTSLRHFGHTPLFAAKCAAQAGLTALLAGVACASLAQTLNLPPRPANALGGQDFVNVISPMAKPPDTQRENWIYAQVALGNVPNWIRRLVPVTTNAVIHGVNHTVTYYVTPDYLAIGSDDDYFLEPMTPMLAQRIATALDCTLPTRKMVNDVFVNMQVKMEPTPIPYNNAHPPVTIPWFNTYNTMVWTQRMTFLPSFPLGSSVGGDKKDVVISTRIYTNLSPHAPNPVVIYGWPHPDGTMIQPLYNGHSEYYMDYSHGIRLVSQAVTVDGAPNTVSNVLTDPNLAALLSDETNFAGNVIPKPYYTVVPVAPVIITQPYALSLQQGATAVLSAVAMGDAPLTFIWQKNGQRVVAGTNSILTLTNLQSGAAGIYSVVITNTAGSVTSFPAPLTITMSN